MKIAIDIALIPPDEVLDMVIGINKKAFELGKGRFHMSREDVIPHVSLCLGIIEEENVSDVKKELNELFSDVGSVELSIEGVEYLKRPDGERSALKVQVSSELRGLHEKVLGVMSKFLVKSEDASMVVEGEKTGISETSKLILNNYEEKFSREKYNAHITLNSYDAKDYCDVKFPVQFDVSRVVFCQVGDGCTCRKVLKEFRLGE